jgi:serine protease inhibitor
VLTGLALAAGAVPLLNACSSSDAPPTADPTAPVKPLGSRSMSRVDVALTDAPELGAVVAGITNFARHLHDAAAAPGTNFTASPLSIAVAFAMLRVGARGSTARQIDDLFEFPPTSDPAGSPHAAMNALTASLVTPPRPQHQALPRSIVSIANAMFVDDHFGSYVERPFLDILGTQYGARPKLVDFASGQEAVVAINQWVDEATRGRISRLFESLDPTTVLVLANAVYLKAAWAEQFDQAATTPLDFTTSSGDAVTAPMMHQLKERARYAEAPDWQLVGLPYADGELSMRVLLPREALHDPSELTAYLRPLLGPAAAMTRSAVDLTMPKWDTSSSLPLLDTLHTLGLTDLTDLSGIAPGLAVSDAVHKANITVDEEGSEAAAATGIAAATGVFIPGPSTPVMRVDRPFVWAVMHEPTGTPTFVGSVVNPLI